MNERRRPQGRENAPRRADRFANKAQGKRFKRFSVPVFYAICSGTRPDRQAAHVAKLADCTIKSL